MVLNGIEMLMMHCIRTMYEWEPLATVQPPMISSTSSSFLSLMRVGSAKNYLINNSIFSKKDDTKTDKIKATVNLLD